MLRYAITDRVRLAPSEPGRRAALLEQAHRCAAAGVDFLQLREKDLPPREFAEIAHAISKIIRSEPGGRTRLLMNSRADVAMAAYADGVHLTSGEGELTPAQVRSLYARAGLHEPVVSLSCHSLTDIFRTRSLAPNLILFGPVFEKVVVGRAADERVVAQGTGLGLLRAVCTAAAPIPVLALGGVTEANAVECMQAGAAGIAGIRLFSDALRGGIE